MTIFHFDGSAPEDWVRAITEYKSFYRVSREAFEFWSGDHHILVIAGTPDDDNEKVQVQIIRMNTRELKKINATTVNKYEVASWVGRGLEAFFRDVEP